MEGSRGNVRLCFCISALLEQNINNGEMLKFGDKVRKKVKMLYFLAITRTSAVLVFWTHGSI